MNVGVKVWLDDERAAPDGWVRVRWPEEAIELPKTGQVSEISLDHDLGDDSRGTGYDVVVWIEEAVALRNFVPPKVMTVHSANSAARARMEAGTAAIERLHEKAVWAEMQRMNVRVGLDFGGVIVARLARPATGVDTDLVTGAGEERAIPGAINAVRELVEMCKGGVWIVSKAREEVAKRTRDWLDAVDFYARTGLPRQHIYFVNARGGKAPIAEQLGLTHFVDDRITTLEYLRRVVPHLVWFESTEQLQVPRWVRKARSWAEVLELMRNPAFRRATPKERA